MLSTKRVPPSLNSWKSARWSQGGKEVAFGEYGLQATTSHWIITVEAARLSLWLVTWNVVVKFGLKIFPHKSYTAKLSVYVWDLVKGAPEPWHQLNVVKMFEVAGVSEEKSLVKRYVLQATSYQLNVSSWNVKQNKEKAWNLMK